MILSGFGTGEGVDHAAERVPGARGGGRRVRPAILPQQLAHVCVPELNGLVTVDPDRRVPEAVLIVASLTALPLR
jgi:hypothetical protein